MTTYSAKLLEHWICIICNYNILVGQLLDYVKCTANFLDLTAIVAVHVPSCFLNHLRVLVIHWTTTEQDMPLTARLRFARVRARRCFAAKYVVTFGAR